MRILLFTILIVFGLIPPTAAQVDTFYWTWGAIPKQDASFTSKAMISGTVKDLQGNPVAQAEIYFDEEIAAKTDAGGRFEFEKNFSGYPKTFALLIRHPSMTDVIRNYHPAMLSANYEIAMNRQADCCRPAPSNTLEMEFSSKKIILDEQMKTTLEPLALKLRQNPNLRMELTGYGENGVDTTLVKYRQEAIVSYLVEEEGISEERIQLNTIKSKKNIVLVRLMK